MQKIRLGSEALRVESVAHERLRTCGGPTAFDPTCEGNDPGCG